MSYKTQNNNEIPFFAADSVTEVETKLIDETKQKILDNRVPVTSNQNKPGTTQVGVAHKAQNIHGANHGFSYKKHTFWNILLKAYFFLKFVRTVPKF